ncbi:MAG TPA: CHAT domain-containing protein, partial [Gemmatimonadaceae bacterium]|nr:CHAT domain-containing protein [Gemmatimonadaceae bacterium]
DGTGYTTVTRALSILRRFQASVWLHGTLNVLATALASDGLEHAAMYFENEQIGVANRTGQRVYVIEAHLGRARLLNDIGSLSGEALADLRIAQEEIDSLPGGLSRDWFRASAVVTQAEGQLWQRSNADSQALDSAVVFFDRVRSHLWLIPALVDRANLRLDRGDAGGGAEDLSHVLAIFDRERADIDTNAFRVSVVRRTRAIADRLVLLRIATGHPDAALDILEHQRVAVSPYASHLVPVAGATHRDEVILDYAFVGDTLLTWVITDSSVRLIRRTVSHTGWTRGVERVRAALELRTDGPQLRHELAAAYATLIAPVRTYVPPSAPLAVVADDDIQAVPFAALYDSTGGRFLAEDHVLRFAPSVEDARSGRVSSTKRPALLVADPAFDATAYPTLARLPGARAEVDSIAAMYENKTILEGSAATEQSITTLLRGARVWHYAGHAILDDEHPERSRLVLARTSGQAAATLRGSDVERLDLRRLDLVVLSACRTLDAQSNGPGGFSGLAASFLTAGAGGVVGGLWQVDDRRTARLMIAFHRAYRESGDPAAALRSAQLVMLRSGDPDLRSPATWAAFRYAGR